MNELEEIQHLLLTGLIIFFGSIVVFGGIVLILFFLVYILIFVINGQMGYDWLVLERWNG